MTVIYTCPRDGGNLDVVLDTNAIRRELLTRAADCLHRASPRCGATCRCCR